MTDLTNPHYDLLGGKTGVRRLVDRFYDLMDTQPETWELRQLHSQNLQSSRDKLFMFLSGWLGGPPLYENAYGHPRLRARHLPFPIDSKMRDQWLMCILTGPLIFFQIILFQTTIWNCI